MNTVLTEVPVPRYSIGQKVFLANTTSTTMEHPCPDCKGSREWTVTTPAGGEFKTECLRCSRYRYSDIPSLMYNAWTPAVRELTIGSVRIDTAPHYHGEAVEYMCEETGVGSGSIYKQSMLFATEAEALAVATAEANEKNAEAQAQPAALERKRVGSITLKDAMLDEAQRSISHAGAFYERIKAIVETEDELDMDYVEDADLRRELETLVKVYGKGA